MCSTRFLGEDVVSVTPIQLDARKRSVHHCYGPRIGVQKEARLRGKPRQGAITQIAQIQDQLLAAFPAFIDTIESKFVDFDYHIMVVDGDDTWGLSTCDEKCPEQCVPDYPCDYTPTTCDTTMGAGVVFPAAYGATNALCPIAGGRRYMAKGQMDLKGTFSCVARLGPLPPGGHFAPPPTYAPGETVTGTITVTSAPCASAPCRRSLA